MVTYNKHNVSMKHINTIYIFTMLSYYLIVNYYNNILSNILLFSVESRLVVDCHWICDKINIFLFSFHPFSPPSIKTWIQCIKGTQSENWKSIRSLQYAFSRSWGCPSISQYSRPQGELAGMQSDIWEWISIVCVFFFFFYKHCPLVANVAYSSILRLMEWTRAGKQMFMAS